MAMEELTGFGMKNSLTLPSLANKYFNSLRDENYEPIYTFTDPFMGHFVRQSIKGGRCGSFNHVFKSTIPNEVKNIISKELGVTGNICEILDKYFEYTIKHRKIIEEKYDSQFKNYRDNDEEERKKHINKELNKLALKKTYKK